MIRARVRGLSMFPALTPGSVVGATRRAPCRGDIVLLRSDGKHLLKRVVGLPGESVSLRGPRVWIDGRLLPEPWVDPRAGLEPLADRDWTLGPGEYVVLGDARDDSYDSRDFGPIRRSQILGTL